ncbi:hypothetical protein BE24_0040 [Staphylococcus phage vB_SepM_BE24]|nr:hypothetical protein BE24_0040 [Staphylococcus phage vB_SepM_BE24]
MYQIKQIPYTTVFSLRCFPVQTITAFAYN